MPALIDLQAQIQTAVRTGETLPLSPFLIGGQRPDRRLAIHARHYEASLVRALLDRFPATVWLVSSTVVIDAARQYVRSFPPSRPCIAEYGQGFPSFLGTTEASGTVPYLRDFAELEYRVGDVSREIARPALTIGDLADTPQRDLPAVRLTVQPGTRYLRATWAVDELLSLYLADSAPDRFELPHELVWLEIRGACGDVRITRLSAAEFGFRAAVWGGHTLSEAAERALAVDPAFDLGRALADVLASGLVTAVHLPETRNPS